MCDGAGGGRSRAALRRRARRQSEPFWKLEAMLFRKRVKLPSIDGVANIAQVDPCAGGA